MWSRPAFGHIVALTILAALTVLACGLEFNEETWSPNTSAEDTEEAPVGPKITAVDAGFAKDTLQRKSPGGRGNTLKELWEVVPLKQQVGIK